MMWGLCAGEAVLHREDSTCQEDGMRREDGGSGP